MILAESKSYTLTYSNTIDNFNNDLPKFQKSLDSFKILSQESSIMTSTEDESTNNISITLPPTVNHVVWDASTLNGATASGSELTKTASTGWGSGNGFSTQSINPSTGGGEIVFMKQVDAGVSGTIAGLTKTSSVSSGAFHGDYMMYWDWVYENNVWNVFNFPGVKKDVNNVFNFTGHSNTDVMKIKMDSNGLVTYYVNDVLIYTSTLTASGDYYFYGEVYNQNKKIFSANWGANPDPTRSTTGVISTGIQSPEEGGGCLIATAAYGSEMSPQVQLLREIRDNQLMNTESGSAFMSGFNELYYSFSPIIADYERENPLFKEAVKIAITPLISSLSLMESANSESEVLGLGLSVIALNLGMYLGVPAMIVIGIKKKF